MITFIGDIHGSLDALIAVCPPHGTVIQVGDFGIAARQWMRFRDEPIYFIDGNHEYFPDLPIDSPVPIEVADGLNYIPRGFADVFEDVFIGFLGGGTSIDRAGRVPGLSWFPEENITTAQVCRIEAAAPVDLLVTHCPPVSAIEGHDRSLVESWGFPSDWRDPNMVIVEDMWNAIGRPPVICGHMHQSSTWQNVRILGICERFDYEPA